MEITLWAMMPKRKGVWSESGETGESLIENTGESSCWQLRLSHSQCNVTQTV